VIERHYRVRTKASHTRFSCSAIRAEDVRRRVARSGRSGTERPEQFFIDKAEQEDADESLHWTRGDYTTRADVEGQRACQRALDFIKAQKLMKVEKLSKAMTKIHAQVADEATRDRKAAIQKHNDKTHVRSPNFKGPRRVASVESDYAFVVENQLTQELKAAHATRLRFYKVKELNVTAELAQAAENNDHHLYVVSKIVEARYN
jgi:hypothetical protein